MTKEKRQSHGRRQVLRATGAAALAAVVLPQSWTKPILRAVVVPAHAQTTPATLSTTTTAKPATTTTANPATTTTRNPNTTTRNPNTTSTQTISIEIWNSSKPDSKLAMVIDSLGLMKS